MTRLVLGPLLRYVGSTEATVWVQTSGPCEVEVLGRRERTWQVRDGHYALVTVTGLPMGATTPYQVHLDGELAWPPPDSPYPSPRIRTIDAGSPVTVAFGSCRYARADRVRGDRKFDADALVGLARCLLDGPSDGPDSQWPDLLLLLGDQVYADETTQATKARIAARRDIEHGSRDQVADFTEYTWLYEESWTDPEVRWLLSTVPSAMIFDDHDVRDDWNTSHSWRQQMQATSWWQERIVGALSSYWVYQHLGNLSPAELATNPLYQQIRRDGGDVEPLLREFAAQADAEADGRKGAQWSYRRDIGGIRVLVLDSRCGRILAHGQRSMVSEQEFRWIEQQLSGDYDHLLVGTSLPWLLAPSLHDIEAWNEALCNGAGSERWVRWSEKIRRGADLEHWAAFMASFQRLAGLLEAVANGDYAERSPASVCVLSGDVHHAYVSQAQFSPPTRAPVYQLTCSPLHNYVPALMRMTFRLAWSRAAERVVRAALTRLAPIEASPLSWARKAGPMFGNQLMMLTTSGRTANLTVQRSGPVTGPAQLTTVACLAISTD